MLVWIILIAVAAGVAWRTGTWPFDKTLEIGHLKIPKFGEHK